MSLDVVERLRDGIRAHYAETYRRHGPSALGVDWPHRAGQEIRFNQLLRIVGDERAFSLNDVGCGYGALLGFLRRRMRNRSIDYLGFDLVPAMIEAATCRYRRNASASFLVSSTSPRMADYALGSGIFNVRLNAATAEWERLVASTLADIHAHTRRGMAVNFLAPASADTRPMPALYRPAPEHWARHCEREFGCSVQLLEGYGQREFTLLLRRKTS